MKRRPISETKETLRGLLAAWLSYNKLLRQGTVQPVEHTEWIAGFIEGVRYSMNDQPVPPAVMAFVQAASADSEFGRADRA